MMKLCKKQNKNPNQKQIQTKTPQKNPTAKYKPVQHLLVSV